MPLLREHKVHATTQESHEELEDGTGDQDKAFKAPPKYFMQKLSQLVVVLVTHNTEIVKMSRRQVRNRTFLYHIHIALLYTQT